MASLAELRSLIVVRISISSVFLLTIISIINSSYPAMAAGDVFSLTTPINVSNSDDSRLTINEQLAVSGDNVFILWSEKLPNFDAPNHVFFSRSTDAGSTFETPIELATGNTPKMATVDPDHIYVVWQSTSGETFFTKSSDGGSTFSEPVNLSLHGSTTGPSVAASGDHVYVVWEDFQFEEIEEIYIKISRDGGETFEESINLSNDEVISSYPAIVALGDDVHIAWTTRYGYQSSDAMIISSNNNGATFESPTKLSSSGFREHPVIAADAEDVYAVFVDSRPYIIPNVSVRVSHDRGNSFEEEIFLSNSYNVYEVPPPHIDVSAEIVYVAWSESGYTLVASSSDKGASFSEPIQFELSPIKSIKGDGNFVFAGWDYNTNSYPVEFNAAISASPNKGAGFTEPFDATQTKRATSALFAISQNMLFMSYIDGLEVNADIYFRTVTFNADQDTTPPVVSIISAVDGDGKELSEGGTTSSDSVNFVFEVTDELSATQDPICSKVTPSYTLVFPPCTSPMRVSTFGAGDGPYQFEIRVADQYGNVGGTEFDFLVDELLDAQIEQQEYSTGEIIVIYGRVGEIPSPPISQVSLKVLDPEGNTDRLEQIDPRPDGSYHFVFAAEGLMNTEGIYTATVSYEGQSAAVTFDFTISGSGGGNPCDDETKLPLVSITSLLNGDSPSQTAAGATFRIEGTASDNGDGCGLARVEIKVKDPITFALFKKYEIATPAAGDDWSTWTHEITLDEERDYSIVARATDKAGNRNWFLNTFTIEFDAEPDETRPTVEITSPENTVTITGPSSSGVILDLEGTAFDNGRGVANVEVKVNDPTTFQLLGKYFQATATGPDGEDDYSTWEKALIFEEEGTYRVTARATDEAGNRNWSHILVKVEFTDQDL